MKPTTFLFAALLLSLVSVAGAADNPTPAPVVAPAAQDLLAEVVSPEPAAAPTNCGKKTLSSPFVQLAWESGNDNNTRVINCGGCSDSQCVGVPRGQRCWLSGYGWTAHCNIFSGGYMCSTGGWECQCAPGDLP